MLIASFMIGLSLQGYWLGSQRSAEEVYIQSSIDKRYVQQEVRSLTAV
jgi:hypothetical protein